MNTGASHMSAAILCLTEGGLRLAQSLAQTLSPVQIYAPVRLQKLSAPGGGNPVQFFDSWPGIFAQIFRTYRQIICIMATGIVVRSLAPLLQDKYNDPAVVVIDEGGRFAISLLSGHRGGANRLAEQVAAGLSGQAVITTATGTAVPGKQA